MAYKCREENLFFLENAPRKVINVVELEDTPENIFSIFEDAQAWTEWFGGIEHVEWTSPKPFGVGTTRTVSLGAIKVWEHFFVWEENKRFSFYFTQTNLPFVKALVEDYQLEVIDDKTTRFTYTVAYEPALPLLLTGPIGKVALKRTFGRAAKSLITYVRDKKN